MVWYKLHLIMYAVGCGYFFNSLGHNYKGNSESNAAVQVSHATAVTLKSWGMAWEAQWFVLGLVQNGSPILNRQAHETVNCYCF
jgi:hypothetical protein